MSEIAIVLPGDWVELNGPGVIDHVLNNIGLQQLQNMIDDASWADITAQLEDFWTPPTGKAMTGARFFSEESVRLFVCVG